MPVCKEDNIPDFVDVLGAFSAIVDEVDPSDVVFLGDFNADPSNVFFDELREYCAEANLRICDVEKLDPDTFTYVSAAHGSTSWLDHCLISQSVMDVVGDVSVILDLSVDDHMPLSVTLNVNSLQPVTVVPDSNNHSPVWSERCIPLIDDYRRTSSMLLADLSAPSGVLCVNPNCTSMLHQDDIKSYYSNIVDALKLAISATFSKPSVRRFRPVPGWNREVFRLYYQSRHAFLKWIRAGRPIAGPINEDRSRCRKLFKDALRSARHREEQLRADALATRYQDRDFRAFWKSTSVPGTGNSSCAVCIDGVSGEACVAALWGEMYSALGNLYPSGRSHAEREETELLVEDVLSCRISQEDICDAILLLKPKKAAGWDGICPEHVSYAGQELSHHLSVCFTAMLMHSFVPDELVKTTIIPIIKNKTGDISSSSNYRPIAISTAFSKVLETVFLKKCGPFLEGEANQFGFKKGVGTSEAVLVLKETIRNYLDRNTPVYACFLDLSKAFDRVHHPTLIEVLHFKGFPTSILRLLQYWNANTTASVRWMSSTSAPFAIRNGVRQGSLLSPDLFNLYMDELHNRLKEAGVGCYLGSQLVNCISYADDMVILSPSLHGLKSLIRICENFATERHLVYNVDKSKLMVFRPSCYKDLFVPVTMLCSKTIEVVAQFKYLGHLLSCDLKDGLDIQRHYKSLCIRANMIARRFSRCSEEVKNFLFKTYCGSLYMGELWMNFTQTQWRKLQVCYNNAYRRLHGLPLHNSASEMFASARVHTLPALRRRIVCAFRDRLFLCNNMFVQCLLRSDRVWRSALFRHWSHLLMPAF